MFCQQCGTQIEDGLAFCTNCGAKQIKVDSVLDNDATVIDDQIPPVINVQNNQPDQQGAYFQGYAQPNNYTTPDSNTPSTKKNVSFLDAIKLFFVNFVNFKGRSTVREYWFVVLFNFIIGLVTSFVPELAMVVSLVLMIPGLSLSVRRLHDTGTSWVYLLMSFIPIVGFVLLIVRFCKKSDGDNKWGPAPRE